MGSVDGFDANGDGLTDVILFLETESGPSATLWLSGGSSDYASDTHLVAIDGFTGASDVTDVEFSDVNGDGVVDVLGRQVPLSPEPKSVSPRRHVQEWYDFDYDRNGFITLPEVELYFRQLQAPESEMKKVFSLMDLDDNGAVTWEEFNTADDMELFDWIERTRGRVALGEIEMVEDMYSKMYGNPYAVQRNEPPAEYDVNQMLRNDKPTKDMKYLEGYGWFSGEDPAVDEEYKGMIITPDPEDTADLAPKAAGSPDEKYSYSYGAKE
jgi:hypothetical protein